jgi:hypothetical protein
MQGAFFICIDQISKKPNPPDPAVYQKASIVQLVEPGSYWWCARHELPNRDIFFT